MEEKRRGYDLPFSADPGVQIAFIGIGLIGIGATVWFAKSEGEPLLQNSADRWHGETAAKYLWRRAESLKGELNLHRHVLWLDWSPERLKLLLEMYPQAQWLDCTQKKLFDAQLKQKP